MHMLDVPHTDSDVRVATLDDVALVRLLSKLSDEDLSVLEDELDFARFTGLPGARMLDVLADLKALDPVWARARDAGLSATVPSRH